MENEAQEIKNFLAGTSHTSQSYFGAHENNGDFIFRVFAPNAASVMLVGDFNGWRDNVSLEKIHESGIWEVMLPFGRVSYGDRYKYRIYGRGQVNYKADPYSCSLSPSPDNSSVICKKDDYEWKDSGWLEYRPKYQKNINSKPVNIYEVHLGSWRKQGRNGCFNYRDYARELAPYVKQMGYTHICLLPITEFFDSDKLDYAPSSFFAPTSRYGSPNDLKAFVDKMHEAGVGVVFDIPISRFPEGRYGLFEFDGSLLYERDIDDHRRHFDLSKKEVQSFLLSSISYWITEYHADAIRIPAMDELLSFYSDSGKKVTEQNNMAQKFLRYLVRTLKKMYPDVLLFAEGDRTDIGFDLYFDSEWSEKMHKYASMDFSSRSLVNSSFASLIQKSSLGTLSIPHADPISENDMFVETMAGDYWQKFAGLRALFGLMMTARGKKLSFMGNEIAQFKSWRFDSEIEWFLLDFESHEKFQRYVAELNNFYLAHSALWQNDITEESFCFVDKNTFEQSVLLFRRSSKSEELVVVVNLTPTVYEDYRIGSYAEGELKEIFNSDDVKYYGSGVLNKKEIKTQPIAYHGYKNSFLMRIPPLAVSILSFKKKCK